MIQPEKLIRMLGKSITDPEVQALKDQGECEITEIDSFIYYSCYDWGFSLNFEQNVLVTIMLYSEGIEDFHAYSDPLPHGLRFSQKKNEVRALLGEPVKTGSDTDIFRFKDHVLYVEYLAEARNISSLTLMTLEKYDE